MAQRDGLCVACDNPSPGPTKRLYYQQRRYGPYFPLLQELRIKENVLLFSGGRACVCTACASFLQRQWIAYEKSWTAPEKRVYKLLSEERAEKQKDKEQENMSTAMAANDRLGDVEDSNRGWKKTSTTLLNQRRTVRSLGRKLNPDVTGESFTRSPLGSNGSSRSSSRNDDEAGHGNVSKKSSRFEQVVRKKVISSRTTGKLKQPSLPRLHHVAETKLKEQRAKGGASTTDEEENDWGPLTEHEDAIQQRVKQRLRKDVEILVRKLAEIQYEDDQKRSEEELKSALERVSKARQRTESITSVAAELKKRLYAEREFRNTELLPEPQLALPAPHAEPLPAIGEYSSAHHEAETAHAQRTQKLDRRHDEIVQELEKEREERRKTEELLSHQQQLIEELRENVRAQMQYILEEQSRRYDELKELIQRNNSQGHKRKMRPSPSDQAYVSLDGSSHSGSQGRDALEDDRDSDEENILRDQNAPRQRPQRRHPDERVRQGGKYWDSGDPNSPSSTPHFYIQ